MVRKSRRSTKKGRRQRAGGFFDAARSFLNQAEEGVSDIANQAKTGVTGLMGNAKQRVSGAMEKTKNMANDLETNVKGRMDSSIHSIAPKKPTQNTGISLQQGQVGGKRRKTKRRTTKRRRKTKRRRTRRCRCKKCRGTCKCRRRACKKC